MCYLKPYFASCFRKRTSLCFFAVTVFSLFLPIYLKVKVLIVKSLSYGEFIESITFFIITNNYHKNYFVKIKI